MNEVTGKNVVAIVQARMGSTRLPGKVMKDILGKPLLGIELERIQNAQFIDTIVVATTIGPKDKTIEQLCLSLNIPVFRGSAEDVLDRYYQAARQYNADVIVRITGDCPLIDPVIIDQVISFFLDHFPEYDYVSNTEARTFPRGLDVEVFSMKTLEKTWKEAKNPEEREHVTPYIYRNRKKFKLGLVMRGTNESHRRWTVDTQEDFELVKNIFEELYPINPKFSMEDVFKVLDENPEWEEINAHIKQKQLDE